MAPYQCALTPAKEGADRMLRFLRLVPKFEVIIEKAPHFRPKFDNPGEH
jgi:hypothetical protein